MARESDFIDKLNDFTKSLDNLVELLKEQQKIGPTEVVNQLLENIDGQALSKIAENIEIVKENTIEINKNVEKTLEVVKSIKKEKETGMFGTIDNKDNKKTIVDGVKTVLLIASGVLAIGMAFKIVGKVDFLSVVALGMGIMFVAAAFATIASVKDGDGKPLTFKKALITSAILITMSGAIYASAWILSKVPLIGLYELITIVGVGAGVGLAAYFMLSALGKIKTKSLALAPLVPAIIPLIAAGILSAALILKHVPPIPLESLISALAVGIALVPIAFAFKYIVKGLKGVSIEELGMAGLAIPLIAMGVVAGSWALMLVADIDLIKTIKAGFGVGLAILAMVPTIYILEKAGLLKPNALQSLAMGALAIPLIATAIVLASWVLSIGTYDKFPELGWTISVGLAIIAFAIPVTVIGAIMMGSSGFGYAALAMGVLAVPLIALAIVAVSYILPLGNYDSAPPLEWTLSVGLLMITFVPSMLLSAAVLPLLILGIVGVRLIAMGIVAVSYALQLGSYDSPPPLEWTGKAGLSLFTFLPMMITAGATLPLLAFGLVGVGLIAGAIVGVSKILEHGSYDVFPSLKWSISTGLALAGFGVPAMALGAFIVGTFGVGGAMLAAGLAGVLAIAEAIKETSFIFKQGDYTGGPTKEWAEGVSLSIGAFSSALLEFQASQGIFSFFTGVDHNDFMDMIKGTATAIVAAAEIFNTNTGVFNVDNIPSKEWSEGVGGAITSFASAIADLSEAGVKMKKEKHREKFMEIMRVSAEGIILVGSIFNENPLSFNEKNIPSKEWAEGVGGSLSSFASAIADLAESGIKLKKEKHREEFLDIMKTVASGIIEVGSYFNKHGIKFSLDKVPKPEWSEGVGKTIESFSSISITGSFSVYNVLNIADAILQIAEKFKTMASYKNIFENDIPKKITNAISSIIEVLPNKSDVEPLWYLIKALDRLTTLDWNEMFKLQSISAMIGNLAQQINTIKGDSVHSLLALGTTLHLISLVNISKLQTVLNSIEAKTKEIKEITDSGSLIRNIFDHIAVKFYDGNTSKTSQESVVQSKTTEKSFEEKLLEHVANIDINISSMTNMTEEKQEREEELKSKDVEDEPWKRF